jgi:hypothetical protein
MEIDSRADAGRTLDAERPAAGLPVHNRATNMKDISGGQNVRLDE